MTFWIPEKKKATVPLFLLQGYTLDFSPFYNQVARVWHRPQKGNLDRI